MTGLSSLDQKYQDAAAAHGRLGSQQILADVVDQRGGGDLEAVRVGSIRKWREGLSRSQGQDLRQRNLLAGPGSKRGLQVESVFCWLHTLEDDFKEDDRNIPESYCVITR